MNHQDTKQMHVVQDLTLEILDLRNKNAEMLEALKAIQKTFPKDRLFGFPKEFDQVDSAIRRAEAK